MVGSLDGTVLGASLGVEVVGALLGSGVVGALLGVDVCPVVVGDFEGLVVGGLVGESVVIVGDRVGVAVRL